MRKLIFVILLPSWSMLVAIERLGVNAFSLTGPTPRDQYSKIITIRKSTRLFGLRSKAKQKVASLKDKLRRSSATSPQISSQLGGEDAVSHLSWDTDQMVMDCVIEVELSEGKENKSPPSDVSDASIQMMAPSTVATSDLDIGTNAETTAKAGMERNLKLPPKDATFVKLPPVDPARKYSASEEEFREKIAYFVRYSKRDMALLKSKRLRVVLDGMAASPLEPAVYRAFEILYSDLLPLRLAGRLIFRRLQQVLKMCVQARTEELEFLRNTTTISQSTLEASQYAFFVLTEVASDASQMDDAGIDNDREHDLVLRTVHLVESSWILGDVLCSNKKEELCSLFDPEQTESIDFPQYLQGLQRFCEKENCASSMEDLLQEINCKILAVGLEDSPRVLDPTRQSYSDNFDSMLETVRSWKKLSANGEGRRWDVLKGCWVGAENDAVRDALRIVYVDVPAMRLAGNTIFALVSALIPKQ